MQDSVPRGMAGPDAIDRGLMRAMTKMERTAMERAFRAAFTIRKQLERPDIAEQFQLGINEKGG